MANETTKELLNLELDDYVYPEIFLVNNDYCKD